MISRISQSHMRGVGGWGCTLLLLCCVMAGENLPDVENTTPLAEDGNSDGPNVEITIEDGNSHLQDVVVENALSNGEEVDGPSNSPPNYVDLTVPDVEITSSDLTARRPVAVEDSLTAEDAGQDVALNWQGVFGQAVLGCTIGGAVGIVAGSTGLGSSGAVPDAQDASGLMWSGCVGGVYSGLRMGSPWNQNLHLEAERRIVLAQRGFENGLVAGAIAGSMLQVASGSSDQSGSMQSSLMSSESSSAAHVNGQAPHDIEMLGSLKSSAETPIVSNALAGGVAGFAVGYMEPEIVLLGAKFGAAAAKAKAHMNSPEFKEKLAKHKAIIKEKAAKAREIMDKKRQKAGALLEQKMHATREHLKARVEAAKEASAQETPDV